MSLKARNDAVLDSILRDAIQEVFGQYGLLLTPVGPSPALRIEAHDAVGVIGFTGEHLRGTLVLATSTAIVAQTCPDTGDQTMHLRDRVRDWVGELANLVLGRCKVALSHHGAEVGLSTPVALTGEHLRLGAVQRSRTRAWDFESPEGGLRAWLEVDLAPRLALELTMDAGREPEMASGIPLLF